MLHRRRGGDGSHAEDGLGGVLRSAPAQAIKVLDAFPKFDDEVPRVKTAYSGIVTIICAVLVFWLFYSELVAFMTITTTSEVGIDTSLARTGSSALNINLDMDMLGLDCDDFVLDVVDTAGGLILAATEGQGGEYTLKKTQLEGVGNEKGKRGCKLSGYMTVKKVEGDFHVGLGKDSQRSAERLRTQTAEHVHYFQMDELWGFNSSHRINRFSFGDEFPGRPRQPLDEFEQIVPEGLMYRYMYFVKVVPTVYIELDGTTHFSYLYSFSTEKNLVNPRAERFWQPGVFFKYEFSSYQVTKREQKQSATQFLTRLCAIAGGVFVVFGFLSTAMYYLGLKLNKRHRNYS